MGDRSRAWYVTSHPGQLSLAIPPWVGTMSNEPSYAPQIQREFPVDIVRNTNLLTYLLTMGVMAREGL